MRKFLGLILARGGSKRIPGKNIKKFLGKPLVAWSIEAGLKSGVLDRLVLSTDDKKIAAVAKKYGAEVPFLRPAELATDTALADDAMRHTIQWLRDNENYDPEWIFVFEPTAPAKQPFHLRDVAKIIGENPKADSIAGISEFPLQYTYSMQVKLNSNNLISRAWDGKRLKDIPKNSLEVPKSYLPNPQIYAFKTRNFFKGNGSAWGNRTYGYLMDSKYFIDIDTPDDWKWAEAKMKELLEPDRLRNNKKRRQVYNQRR